MEANHFVDDSQAHGYSNDESAAAAAAKFVAAATREDRHRMAKQPIPANMSYAEIVRMKIHTGDNPTRKPISTRQLSEMLGVTYEHTRQILGGKPSLSRELSDKLCGIIGLNPDVMWAKLAGQKFSTKFGFKIGSPQSEANIAEFWGDLTDSQKENLYEAAKAMAALNRASSKKLVAG